MKRDWFIKAIDQLIEMTDMQIMALMCSEEDPSRCHRHHLIAKYLIDNYPEIDIVHIRGDGKTFKAITLKTSVDESPGDQLSLF